MAITYIRDSIKVESYNDSTAPLAFVCLNGRRVYKIRARLQFDTTEANGKSREYKIFIDSVTGQLIKITSTLPSYHSKVASGDLVEQPRPRQAERFSSSLDRVQFVEFPSRTPRASFFKACERIPGGALSADRVNAWYGAMKLPPRGIETVWCIETWGAHTYISSGISLLTGRSQTTGQAGSEKKPTAHYLRAIVGHDGTFIVAGG
jgi:hypothetical protein